ncbi:MAG: lysophospholipid acyltransferase family protein [Candidatus Thermoplasmatota archaeon]|nr:lysophospholipid acyltransferase family protein [Candidatus Thermoplasmatota archaeon]
MSSKAPLSYRTTNLTLGTFLRIMFRPRYLGRDKIPVDGPLIIAANHLSHIDPAFIMTATKRPVSYMSKKEHFEGAIRRLVFKQVGVIPVDREEGGKEALNGAIEILEEGGAIGIFPEGTRSRDGKMGKGKTGVARLAALTGAAVVPVAIRQTDGVWPVSKRAPRPWRKFYYKFGDPIYFDYKEKNRENFRKFTDSVMSRIVELSNECEDYWEEKKITTRLKKRIAAWREK